ncbi:probable transmembrane protein [Thiobacillus denitrificans ATCC 25259]|uniref:Probable transmembrane protein n=1 Tax=Thiobacillus denitrificans (strain ATCC 25259 / T1) TaxID=292415 RepID=Q3SJI6_THIDA|nr:membrane protein [Thiobacillus denitrificans]AAZ97171.1 probable transmembrane protein [Thiobacillus denitrificans ATCC 25259]
MNTSPDNGVADDAKLASLKSLTTVTYALYALSLVVGVTAIVAIVLNYIKKDDARGTWLESHFTWQIRTFWWSVVWFVLGSITVFILIGWVVLGVAYVWFIYRIAKGWLNLNDNKPMAL